MGDGVKKSAKSPYKHKSLVFGTFMIQQNIRVVLSLRIDK